MQIEFKKVGLDTLGGSGLQARFQQQLEALVEQLQDPDAESANGVVKGELILRVRLEHTLSTEAIHLSAGLEAKPPKMRAYSQSAIVEGGAIFVEADRPDTQTSILSITTPKN